jgi:hypothetical protein
MKAAVVVAVALFCVFPAVAEDYTFTTLDFSAANHTYVQGINNAGQVVGDCDAHKN